jgi:putative membrane protein
MANEQQGGTLKHFVGKVTDTIGGMVGQMGASMSTNADSFVESAAIGDMYEITAAKIALKRSHSDPVRAIAEKMIEDHTENTRRLQEKLATSEARDVARPPQSLDSRRRSMVDHLEEAPDDSFDSTYIDQQLMAHEETVTLMHAYRDSGDLEQLRSFAAAAAPVVEGHLEDIKRLRAMMM